MGTQSGGAVSRKTSGGRHVAVSVQGKHLSGRASFGIFKKVTTWMGRFYGG